MKRKETRAPLRGAGVGRQGWGVGGQASGRSDAFCLLSSVSCLLVGLYLFALAVCPVLASDSDEFRVKREAVFEFAEKPKVTRQGDTVTIEFETKGFCDVTVAIEAMEHGPEKGSGTLPLRSPTPFPQVPAPSFRGRIIRHLASGVLGPNAPEPFQKNSKKQTIVWDGKNDKGEYVDDLTNVSVRVSLGLKPQFERALNVAPQARVSGMPPAMCPAEEGVYVYDGMGVDHLRLFDHEGRYLRTIYPFETGKLGQVKGLKWFDFPQGDHLPLKGGSHQQTFLTSGDNAGKNGMGGSAATAMAVHPDGRIALVHERLNRLHRDGTTGGRDLLGDIDVTFPYRTYGTNADGRPRRVAPTSAALSPDGRLLYLAGYAWRITWHFDLLHGLVRIPFEGEGKPELFAGSMKQDDKGADNAHFNGATSVACDRQGRVYVSDLVNDRIQVFAPDGAHLKTIPVYRPAQVVIHPRTQDIFVFSWAVYTRDIREKPIIPTLAHLGPFEDPREKAKYPLPWPEYRGGHNEWWDLPPLMYRGAVDGYTDPPTIWLAGGQNLPWPQYNIRLLREKGDKLEVVRDFGQEVVRARGRPRFAPFNFQMQRLAVNPKTGRLYLMEPDSGPANKAYKQLVEFDPETGTPKPLDLPFDCEDLTFDIDGFVYLRSTDVVVRYDSATWVEKPWDYGQDLASVSCGGRAAPAVSGLVIPSVSPVCFHQGGMAVSSRGNLAVSCAYRVRDKPRQGEGEVPRYTREYKPLMYPGLVMSSTSACLHVWDDRGRIVHEDAVKGMPQVDGVGLDEDGHIYVLATPSRLYGGKPYFNKASETLMKLDPAKARFISTWERAAIPLPKDAGPDRPMDVQGAQFGAGWVEGAQWMYGGVGFAGFNDPGCACWHVRFALDYFARSFVPELERCRVGVLDKNGNLILRLGQYGNADDGVPLISDQGVIQPARKEGSGTLTVGSPTPFSGPPPGVRSIGGDEIALFYGAFLATHTDHRLYIADIGNDRIVQVKLGYHTTERIALSDVKERP